MSGKAFDIIIVGSGIAGLSTLLYLTESDLFLKGELSICLIAKGSLNDTNTYWAQGGIAAVKSITDNFSKHISDTLTSGDFSNDKAIVKKVISAGPGVVDDLIRWGTLFDKVDSLHFDLAREGGHSEPRILHYQDQTGKRIQDALINCLKNLKNVFVASHTSLINIEKPSSGNFNLTAYDINAGSFKAFSAKKLVLATGGLGMLYEASTNHSIATGEGVYYAHKLGAKLENLSFVQFHPTGLYQNGQRSFLISEALRGAGAILRNEKGVAFMSKYDERLDLAPRDIVSRAISYELDSQLNPFVYLDATKIERHYLRSHFPVIMDTCKHELGINIETSYIPVVPVQHYACGGVKVNEFGESSVEGLFVIGESASTGLHGANRLASNSLLEAIAFAKFSTHKLTNGLNKSITTDFNPFIPVIKKIERSKVQRLVSESAGIIKTHAGLSKGLFELENLKYNSTDSTNFVYHDFESYTLLEVAILLLQDARSQNRNQGVFYNLDLL